MTSVPQHTFTQLKQARVFLLVLAIGLLLLILLNSFINLSITHPKTSTLYALYMLMCVLTLASHRQSLLHPACLFVYTSLLGFGLSIPLFCTRYFPGIQFDDDVMSGVCLIVLTSTGATILGTFILPRFTRVPKFLKLHTPHTKVSLGKYFVWLGGIALCGVIRLTLHLGEPGVQPNLPFSGVLQFIFYEGAIVASLWYLSRGLQAELIHIILALSLLAAIALIQSLLGWRGGVFAMIMAGTGIFLLQDANLKSRSPFWLAILGLAAVFLINLGNEIRAGKLGGEAAYAKTEEGFITRVLYRSQGTSRLAAIVKYYGEVSTTNNMKYQELNEENISATTFIDRKIYGIEKSEINSIGTSGPGGPYVNFGLAGVFIAYLGLGVFFKFIYNLIWASHASNPTAKIMYSYLILTAVQTQSENFGMLQLKCMLAIFVLGFSFNYLVQALFSANNNGIKNKPQIGSSEPAAQPLHTPALFHT